MMRPIPKRLFTTEEASHYLGRSPWVICKMTRDGLLPYVPSGKKKLLDVRDLDRWIENAKTQDY